MRTRPFPWLSLALALTAASTAARIVDRPTLSIEPARTQRAHLSATQHARLDSLLNRDSHAAIEYWVTPAAQLPPDLRSLEPAVRAAFQALRSAHPDRLRLTVHHPADSPDLAPHLDSLGIRSTRAARITDDRATESELTSSLRFTLNAHPASVRNALLPAHTHDLPELLLTHLEALAQPQQPRVLLDCPDGYLALESLLGQRAAVRRAAIDSPHPTTPDDLIVWIQPAAASPAALAHAEAHLRSGGDLLLAASTTTSTLGRAADEVILQFTPAPATATALSPFGVTARPGVLLDPLCDAIPIPNSPPLPAHHFASVPATHQDFRPLAGQPNGSLLFVSPTALDLDPARLQAHGYRAAILATASPRALTAIPPTAPLQLSALSQLPGTPAPRAPLAALLTPSDPSRGRVLILSSASPLADAHLSDERYQHLALARVLLDTLASTDRHLLRRATGQRAPALPLLTTRERTRIRLALLLGAPLLLSVAFLVRRRRTTPAATDLRPAAIALFALVLTPAAVSFITQPFHDLGHDATADHRHQLDAASTAHLRSAHAALGATATLTLHRPPRSQAPVELSAALDRVAVTLSNLAAAAGITYRQRTSDYDQAAAALDLTPTTQAESTTEERRVHILCTGALLALPDGRHTTLDLSDLQTHERLPFRLGLALNTLQRGAPPLLAIASDRPLLSPAEAVLDYQNQGHFAPGGADPYAPASAWLRAHGFATAHVEPRDAQLPPDTDAFLLFQPRRDATALYTALFDHLHSGGRALLAAQAHDFLARRLAETDHTHTYWPRPLYPDLDRPPFTELGLSLDPRLLLDARHTTALLPTRIDRPDLPPHTELLPATEAFCLRILGNAATGDSLRGGTPGGAAPHGDLILAGANSLHSDPALLSLHHLSLTPWLHASNAAWSHAWEGGDLTPQALNGAPTDPANSHHTTPPLLAADLSGPFPTCHTDAEGKLHLDTSSSTPQTPDDVSSSAVHGRLSFIASSAPFRAAHLHATDADHAQLLLLAAARLALEPDLVHLLKQRAAPRGFELPAPAERLLWRLLLIGGAPLLLACIGLRRMRSAA